MELVVHHDFPFNGTDYKRGDVIRGADVAEVRAHQIFASYCSARADEQVAPPPALPSAFGGVSVSVE